MRPEYVARSLDSAVTAAGRRVLAAAPELEPLLLHARDRYARAYVRATEVKNRLRYDAPVDPYQLIRVDPGGVDRVLEHGVPMYRQAGTVVAGDWDLVDTRFEELDAYRAYEAHFERGVPWSETAFYDRVVDEIRSGEERWGCNSKAAFDERCERLDELYDAIATEGFHSQASLAEGRVDDPVGERRGLLTERWKAEVAVHVGRDGGFLFSEGRNRLCIAKLLDLDAIPVRVLRRHERWQRVRDAYVRGHPELVGLAHPDVAALEFGGSPGTITA